ncbi:hypothetical protein FOFC_13976 [Fusarium oxysporum]|nr:hypothetical protein FOFC_13976 [Fusarium oxysporum]
MRTFDIFTNRLKDLLDDTGGITRRDQGADYYPFNNDPLSTMAERPTGSPTKLPTSWIAEPGIDRRNSWIMSDVTFELDFARGMNSTAGRGPSEARLGTLGMNDVFDLDMDLAPTMMNLYAT